MGQSSSKSMPSCPLSAARCSGPSPFGSFSDSLSCALSDLRISSGLPALAVLSLTQFGASSRAFCVGLRRFDRSWAAVDWLDRWHLGSNGKALTAAVAGRLVDKRVVQWHTSMGEIFGGRVADSAAWSSVTLAQLLAMKAGVAELDRLSAAQVQTINRLTAQSLLSQSSRNLREQLIGVVTSAAPACPPYGQSFEYSNLSYLVAGAMLEESAQQDWETLVKQEIFQPLAMEQAGFGPPADRESEQQPHGHATRSGFSRAMVVMSGGASLARQVRLPDSGEWRDNPPLYGPAGSIHCSVLDYSKWLTALLRRDPAFLSASSWKMLLEGDHHNAHNDDDDGQADEISSDYHCGWMRVKRPWAGRSDSSGVALTHTGSNTLWYQTTWLAPQRGWAFAAFTNCALPDAHQALDRCIAMMMEEEARTEG